MPVDAQPQQDKDAGALKRERRGNKWVTTYDPAVALGIVERIAMGELLKDICAPGSGNPHRNTFYRWIVNNPALGRAYNAARELSAQGLEEEALGIASTLQHRHKKMTGTDIRALEAAMGQFRWSAIRRDPAKYGERSTTNLVVPIQINTSLDMGGSAAAEEQGIYTIEATVDDAPLATPDGPKKLKRVLTPRSGKAPQSWKEIINGLEASTPQEDQGTPEPSGEASGD